MEQARLSHQLDFWGQRGGALSAGPAVLSVRSYYSRNPPPVQPAGDKRKNKKFKAIPHNSKCRCSEREVQAAKRKTQIILCVLSSIFATQIVLRSRGSGA